jgi:plastocyanin
MKFISSSSLFALFACAMMTSSSLGADVSIDEWIIPSDGGPYPPIDVNVGDTITFLWPGTHTVQINPSMSCDLTDTAVIGDTSPTSYTFVDGDGSPDGTTHLFVCGIGDGAHCEAGKMNGVSCFDWKHVHAVGMTCLVIGYAM